MWPTQVLVLDDDCNISGPYGITTPGNPASLGFYGTAYPNYLHEWTTFSFRTEKGSNHLSSLEWQTTYNRIGTWQTRLVYDANQGNIDEEFFRLLYSVRDRKISNFNYRAKLIYNLAWAYHGYEPYPEPIPELLSYMKNHHIFQKLVADGIERAKSPFLQSKDDYAKKKDPRPKARRNTKLTLA